jgi:glutamate-1-semialdehyde 2,1-aminomutase
MNKLILLSIAVPVVAWLGWRLYQRILLSLAKHPSLAGHPRMARRLARLLPRYDFDESRFFKADGAPEQVEARRRDGFEALAEQLRRQRPSSIRSMEELSDGVSDLAFVSRYRVPFPFSGVVREHLAAGVLVENSEGVTIRDVDGNEFHDLTGSYGVNVLGLDSYKACIEEAVGIAGDLGPVLGPYNPVLIDNVARLRKLSGMDQVSFHMSGTEAVMQAVRLARYHTGRSHVVRFCGAYHGWWDDVQPGVGNPGPAGPVYTLAEMRESSLRALLRRRDVACVLVNPLQALHPNTNAPGDGALLSSNRRAGYDRQAYTRWLESLREVCTQRGIVLIFDDVFVGFRIAVGGSQSYFGVKADLVTLGKTLGGGLPIGVVCGGARLMQRFRDARPADICFARGTFNSHPLVMAAMNAFLRRLDDPQVAASIDQAEPEWDRRAQWLNGELEAAGLPVRVFNLCSIFTVVYDCPSRYNWMLQFYLNAEGLLLPWVGTGRLIFSHNYTDRDFAEVVQRFVRAARRMNDDGWWWQDAALTQHSIKRRIRHELLAARLGRQLD